MILCRLHFQEKLSFPPSWLSAPRIFTSEGNTQLQTEQFVRLVTSLWFVLLIYKHLTDKREIVSLTQSFDRGWGLFLILLKPCVCF